MHSHVFNTWVTANLLHPFVFLIGGCIAEGGGVDCFAGMGLALIAGLMVMVVSFPSLVAAWIIFPLICKLPFTTAGKFGSWFFIATCLPYLNGILLVLLIGDTSEDIFITSLAVSGVAMFSVAMTVCIRIKYFFQLFHQPQIISNETNLV